MNTSAVYRHLYWRDLQKVCWAKENFAVNNQLLVECNSTEQFHNTRLLNRTVEDIRNFLLWQNQFSYWLVRVNNVKDIKTAVIKFSRKTLIKLVKALGLSARPKTLSITMSRSTFCSSPNKFFSAVNHTFKIPPTNHQVPQYF